MSEHRAKIRWTKQSDPFTYESYTRDHDMAFGTGQSLGVSAAEQFRGNPALPNPEELLVGAASSCHMLTFLAICAKRRIVVASYEDDAVGKLAKDAEGKLAITEIVLHPKIRFEDPQPEAETIARIHEASHRECFIARSLKTDVRVAAD